MNPLQLALNQVYTDAWFDILYCVIGILFFIVFIGVNIIASKKEEGYTIFLCVMATVFAAAFLLSALRDCIGEFTNPDFYAHKYLTNQ